MPGGEALRIEIWLLAVTPADNGLLAPDERRRADRFRRPGDRATYVAAHAALRLLAGARLGVPPADVRFAHEACPLCGAPHGRPTLADTGTAPATGPPGPPPDTGTAPATGPPGPPPDAGTAPGTGPPGPPPDAGPALPAATAATDAVAPRPAPAPPFSFSLSRTDGSAAVALAPAVVGVDIESTGRSVGLDDLTAALHPAELPVPDRREALRRWVRKEAYLKGMGTGLGVDPATVDLTADPPGWQIVDVPTGSDALAAVAVRSPAPVVLDVRTATVAELAAVAAAAPSV